MRRYYHYLLWLVVGSVVFVPLLTKNHIVHKIVEVSDDFSGYVAIVNSIASGETIWTLYPAQLYFGKFLALIINTFHIDTANLILSFYFLLLLVVIAVIYFVVSNITDRNNGWIAVGISMFCTTGILGLFSYGVIFSVLNMYVFLLCTILFASKWLAGGRWYYLVLSLIFATLYSGSHLTSLYAPYAMLVMLGIIILVKSVKRRSFSIKKPIALWSIVFVSNIVMAFKLWPIYFVFMNKVVNNNIASVIGDSSSTSVVVEGISRDYQVIYDPIAFSNYVMNFLSIATTIVLILVIVAVLIYRNKITYSTQTKYMVGILGGFIVALGVGSFTVLSPDPVRAGIDMSTLLAITIVVVLGSIKVDWLRYSVAMLVGMFSIITIISWVR